MEKYEGKYKRVFIDSVRGDLKHYARSVDVDAKKTEEYAAELALKVEELNALAPGTEFSLEKMNSEYTTLEDPSGTHKMIKKNDFFNGGSFYRLHGGCQRVALTSETMRLVKSYESAEPLMMHMYDDLENADGIYLFDTESNIVLMRVEFNFKELYDLPGFDIAAFHEYGLNFYDWYKFVDKENNPGRKALWSDLAFISVEHDWIMHLKAPIYRNRYSDKEKMIGIIGIHYNLDRMINNTIAKSSVRMMIVKDNSTLVGLNESAKKDIKLEIYDQKKLESTAMFDAASTELKKKIVFEKLNLEKGKGEDVHSFANRLKAEYHFNHRLFGRSYTIIKERSTELGLDFVALLPDDEW